MAEAPGSADEVDSSAEPRGLDILDCVSVDVPGADDLKGPARVSFERHVRAFAMDLLQESSREELASRANTSDTIQYTSSHVETAALFVRRRGVTIRKRSKLHVVAAVAGPVAYTTAGVFLPMSPQSVWWAVVGTAAFTAAVLLSIYVETDRKEMR